MAKDIKNITVQLPDGSSMQKLGQGTWRKWAKTIGKQKRSCRSAIWY